MYNVEWLNSNNTRLYPFKEDANMTLVSDVVFHNSILVDAIFTVSYDFADKEFNLNRVIFYDTTLILDFRDSDGYLVGTCAINVNDDPYTVYRLTNGQDRYTNAVCFVTIGTIQNLPPYGVYTDLSIPLSKHTLRPMLQGVSSITVKNTTGDSPKLYGDIILRAGENISLSVDQEENSITINAISSFGFAEEECECDNPYVHRECIKTINNVSPDDNRNIELQGLECVNLTTDNNNAIIKIEDTCSVPCCGCDELDKLANSYSYLDANISRIQTNINSLMSNQHNFYVKYLLGILNDTK